ncbi:MULTISPECIES: protein translocase subunit SecF [unclassified Novosphingobium]|uniref:protein translocase subunit SecF n=1 Tax=unclassified Novosphingobium TaxID=2644732 RepID=UPI0014417B3A|nr:MULTISPECIES: protein translocase subunit SecF [unclassified Novosphingobium]MBB3358423.1 preprotein translocase subunit SecF [Novosphingobium sp. BK256]MBB3374784.1 preprotein translocase subunit SecF [Novosphingobium sp. BK280]MBB3379527.1 preprotein translocase subunit SecF [Novosphingobium sp. BK258]MBB3421222.1 preprotein translocase subunit SecF [Novosphingobium sp. BK267]MBB3449205.1 preprotein translocase subunit SecF [Novosphingobium sp. BK352]
MKLLKLVPDNTNVHFLKWRVPFYLGSLLLMAASLGLVFTKGLNLGVDFVGGQMIRVTFERSAEAPVADLRSEVAKLGYGEPIIQRYGKPNEISIRMKLPEGSEHDAAQSDKMARTITADIKSHHADARIDGIDSVSGKVSGELKWDAFKALGLAALAVAAYIWMRFEWQFGVGALFSLVHDVTLTLGMFALTQMEFDLNIVAALLTLIGYSLNDTIVVYDRVRENLKKYRKMPLPELLDLSVNETLARTIVTSLSMLITLVALLAFGPEVIFGFTAAITLGIFVGTYSSIYMAAPILIWLKVNPKSFVPTETALEKQERLAREGA